MRASTLEELLPLEARAEARLALQSTTLAGAFDIFRHVHAAVCSERALARVVREALEDAAADGICYIELRSTPRLLRGGDVGGDEKENYDTARALELPLNIEQRDAGLHRYVAVVGAALVDAAAAMPQLVARLLVSLDRGASEDSRAACARVAVLWSSERVCGLAPSPHSFTRLVVGVDVSGDPRKGGDISSTIIPTLDALRDAGLCVSFHLGEMAGAAADAETAAILKWRPDRVGHLALVGPLSIAVLASLGPAAPPVEVCPTSNALTLSLESLHAHPTLGERLAARMRIAICTDDPSIFKTTLSRELEVVALAFLLNRRDVARLSAASFDYAFAEPHVVALGKDRAIKRFKEEGGMGMEQNGRAGAGATAGVGAAVK